MYFNKIVRTILETRNILIDTTLIPRLDGKREMYQTWVYHDGVGGAMRVHDETDLIIYDSQRRWGLMYSGNNGQQAIEEYEQYILLSKRFKKFVHKAMNIAQILGSLKGTFQVVDTRDYICFYLDLDIDYYINQQRQDTPFKDFDF